MKKIKVSNIFRYVFVFFIVAIFLYFGASFSSFIDNGENVAGKTELTYYIDVTYDGKDAKAVTSNGTVSANVLSDYIFVEYILPSKLEFVGFVKPSEGTDIGAALQEDEDVSCYGYVVDGVDGLSYNSTTRTVSYKIKNLQAGCKLTVGVITKTPALGYSERLDFYGTTYIKENLFSVYSNTTHTFMGEDPATLHTLSYTYEGDVPDNAPELPNGGSYISNSTVSLVTTPKVDGYTFDGWRIDGITINSDGTFTMPDNDVVAVGSFTRKTDYTVSYKLTNDIVPAGYILPDEQTYPMDSYFEVDTLKSGDIISGYVFSGWDYDKLSNCVGNEDDGVICLMSSSDVELTGHFEEVKYTVSYEFIGDNIPDNASELLPASVDYNVGDTVTVADDVSASGYTFLGWYKSATFDMPAEDVVIYGEWLIENETFIPTISQEIENEENKKYFSDGDKVSFKTTVSNNSTVDIYDVILQADGSTFDDPSGSAGYVKKNDQFVAISKIAAGESFSITSSVDIGSDDVYKVCSNRVELLGAIANDDYFLDTSASANYSTTVNYVVLNVNLGVLVRNGDGETLSGALFSLYGDSTFNDEPIATDVVFKNLEPGKTYYLKQYRVPTGYVMAETITINVSEEGIITADGVELESVDNLASLYVVNDKINLLPQTGGSGNVPFILIGLGIITMSAVIYIIYLKKGCDKYA